MSTPSYIRAVGDSDYNFSYNDFTVEFFAETITANGCQTLFEITNNESPAANLYTNTRFMTVIESGNLNAYGIETIAPFYVNGNATFFTTPVSITANSKIFYDGQLLQPNQYVVTGNSNVTISNITISTTTVLAEVGQVLFEVLGNNVSANSMHFISAERYQEQFYLFLDGQSQNPAVSANVAIPAQVITNTVSHSNVFRFDSPALLTIGANKDGQNPLYGAFGDIKIVNGNAIHVQPYQMQNTIESSFTDFNLGTQPSDIIIDGGNFVDSLESPAPEEYVPGQMFDTLFFQVYQSSTSNVNSNILSFIFFKPIIMAGPVGSFSYISPASNVSVSVPWTSLDAAAASVLVNGNAISSIEWVISNGTITVSAGLGDNVEIISTGPTTYYDVNSNSVSVITSNIYANSTTINVANTSPFITPIIGSTANIANNALLNVRGQVFVNQECITYLYIDRTANTLSGLMRGTSGTGVPNVHVSGSRIISASYTNDLQNLSNVDPRTAIWYTVPLANTSLQNTHTIISNTLVSLGGISPVTPF
jgi:hypothetical protein